MQLNLNQKEIEFILNSLSQQPYVQVHQLIDKIHGQASAQLQSAHNNMPQAAEEAQVLNGQAH